ncbi:MAG: radical SAM protein [Chlamydiia bacterium]|nr:radical SAM protein [Chlamydiia bacterium]
MSPNPLYLTEMFTSIQGETSRSGLPTVFIRLSGCPLRCTWCDTPYSFKRGDATSIADILDYVDSQGVPYVCVTGGEPLSQPNVYGLMDKLVDRKFKVSLETSGAVSTQRVNPEVKVVLDVKCPGSGESAKQLLENFDHLRPHDEVKFVILDRQDFDYAIQTVDTYALESKVEEILFSPVHGKLDPQTLIAWLLAEKRPYRLNLQIHKYVWEPQTRGV